jgi:DNA-binding NarL/FixJ family response regulator
MMAPQAVGSEGPLRKQMHAAADQRVRVLLADQDGLARRMMQNALQEADGVVVITGARDGREALELARHYRPTVLLADIALPPTGGVELTRKVLAIAPEVRVVTVSAAGDDDEAVLTALLAGAVGHIDKDTDPDQLARLVTLAADGEAVVPRRLTTRLLERWREIPVGGWRPLRSTLTTREWQVIELLSEGASTEHISERLVLSPSTVYTHIYRLLRKLGVHSRRDAVAAAQRLRREEAMQASVSPRDHRQVL